MISRRSRVLACAFVVLLGADARPLLCAKLNGVVVSRTDCRKHEQAVPVSTILPAPRAALTAARTEPVGLTQTGSKIAALTLPSGKDANYVLLATVSFRNNAQTVDTASCSLVLQAPGRTDPFGLRLADSSVALNGGATATTTLLGALPTVDPSTLQNGSGAVALWCFASTPGATLTSGTTSLVAVPVDGVKTQ